MKALLLVPLLMLGCAKKPVVVPEPSAPVEISVPKAPKPPRPATRVNKVLFAFDSYEISERDMGRITKDCLTYPGPRVLVGFASNERSGKYKETASKAYNLILSTKRAQAVQTAYTLAGCMDSRVDYLGETVQFGRRLEANRRVTVQ